MLYYFIFYVRAFVSYININYVVTTVCASC